MARDFSRTKRIADQVRKDLSIIIQREVKDPRVSLVTINEVRISKDLGYADIYFTCMNLNDEADAQKESEKVLNGAASFLRTQLASAVNLRVVPALRFHYDQILGNATRMNSLIRTAVADLPPEEDDNGEKTEG